MQAEGSFMEMDGFFSSLFVWFCWSQVLGRWSSYNNFVALSPQANYTDWATATRSSCLHVKFWRANRGLCFGKSVKEILFLWRMVSSGMLRRVALVRTDVSEERSPSFIRVTRIGELGATLAVTSNRRAVGC
jgi:hypothetical protein